MKSIKNISKKERVMIFSYTKQPERICALAAKVSNTPKTAIKNIFSPYNAEKDRELISKVIKLGHISIIEHISFTFAFENVSVFFEQFMIEHRLISLTIKSRRFVDFSKSGYYMPNFRFTDEESEKKYKRKSENLYLEHMNWLFSNYEYLVKRGVPKEDARFILPYSFFSSFYCTVNARELAHILFKGIYGSHKEYQEINEICNDILNKVKAICPTVFNDLSILEKGEYYKNNEINKLIISNNVSRKCISKCELINYTKNPEKTVVISAIIKDKLCSFKTANELVRKNKKEIKKILKSVILSDNPRELEQIYFTYKLSGLSLAGVTHLVRHRIQSIIIPQFTKILDNKRYIVPGTVKKNNELFAKYNIIWKKHKALLKTFKKWRIFKEDLIYMNLSGDLIDVVTTMNGRELLKFFKQRTCRRAQWEIRIFALQMLINAMKTAPNIFLYAGPSCYTRGYCCEGNFGCGNLNKSQKFFKSLNKEGVKEK